MSTIGELGSFLAQEATAARLYTAARWHVDSGGSRRSVLFERGTTKGSD